MQSQDYTKLAHYKKILKVKVERATRAGALRMAPSPDLIDCNFSGRNADKVQRMQNESETAR